MRSIGLPTMVPQCSVEMLYKGLEDAVEHRHGTSPFPPTHPPTHPKPTEQQLIPTASSSSIPPTHPPTHLPPTTGKQRIPLITGIGSSVCVSDITREELEGAVKELYQVHGLTRP